MMTSAGHWFPAYVGLGSNLNGPARQLASAFDLLAEIPETRLLRRSSLYRSAPFGGIEQPDFINAAAALLTRLPAGPRVLDLDLLVYSDQRINDPELIVPHPGIAERNFVLLPLQEVAPGLSVPGLGLVKHIRANLEEPEISCIG